MLLGFAAGYTRILNLALPALLSSYQVKSVMDLPSPLKGEILFLKGLIRCLIRFQSDAKDQEELVFSMAAAVKRLSRCFPEVAAGWYALLLLDPENKPDLHFEVRMFNQFIALMFKWTCFSPEHAVLFRNADSTFDGYAVFCQALSHVVELQRLQLMHADSKPQLKQVQVYDLEISQRAELLGIEDGLFSYFSAFSQPAVTEMQLHDRFQTILHRISAAEMTTSSLECMHAHFLKSSVESLMGSSWPADLRYWVCAGLLKLVHLQLQQAYSAEENKTYKQIVVELIAAFNLERLSEVEQWKTSYAAFMFCKFHLFKQGRPEKGLALTPLFSLDEGGLWGYWQQALNLLTAASQQLIKSQLAKIQLETQLPSMAGSPYRFYTPPADTKRGSSLPSPEYP